MGQSGVAAADVVWSIKLKVFTVSLSMEKVCQPPSKGSPHRAKVVICGSGYRRGASLIPRVVHGVLQGSRGVKVVAPVLWWVFGDTGSCSSLVPFKSKKSKSKLTPQRAIATDLLLLGI